MIAGTIVLARNEMIQLVHAIDSQNDSNLSTLLPSVREQLMREINRIDSEGDW